MALEDIGRATDYTGTVPHVYECLRMVQPWVTYEIPSIGEDKQLNAFNFICGILVLTNLH